MNQYSLPYSFSLSDLPATMAPRHKDNFAEVLRLRQARDDAWHEAKALQEQADAGMTMSQADWRRMLTLWARYRVERDDYNAMLQDAMDAWSNDYESGFGH